MRTWLCFSPTKATRYPYNINVNPTIFNYLLGDLWNIRDSLIHSKDQKSKKALYLAEISSWLSNPWSTLRSQTQTYSLKFFKWKSKLLNISLFQHFIESFNNLNFSLRIQALWPKKLEEAHLDSKNALKLGLLSQQWLNIKVFESYNLFA